MASPVFEGLFSIPQPLSGSPVVDVPETSQVLEPILRLCYPVDKPDLSDIVTVAKILAVAEKYEMASIIAQLDPILVAFIPSAPKQAFALACRHEIERVARDAATHLSSNNSPIQITPDTKWEDTLPGRIYVEEMTEISAGAYYRLLEFLNGTGSAGHIRSHPTSYFKAQSPSRLPSWYTATSVASRLPLCPRIRSSTDIDVYAIDGTKFPAHSDILAAASEEFQSQLSSSEDASSLHLPEVGDILGDILRSCYPGGGALDADTSLSRTASILAAAVRYKLPVLVDSAKRRMMEFVKSRPLELYLRAVTIGWKDAARAAAVRLTRYRLSTLYHSQLENVPAKYYQALLKFDFEYKKAHVNSLPNLIQSHQTAILNGSCWAGTDWDSMSGETTPESIIGLINIDLRSTRCCSSSLSQSMIYYGAWAKRSQRELSQVRENLSILTNIPLILGPGPARFTGHDVVIDLNDPWISVFGSSGGVSESWSFLERERENPGIIGKVIVATARGGEDR